MTGKELCMQQHLTFPSKNYHSQVHSQFFSFHPPHIPFISSLWVEVYVNLKCLVNAVI